MGNHTLERTVMVGDEKPRGCFLGAFPPGHILKEPQALLLIWLLHLPLPPKRQLPALLCARMERCE